MLAVLHTRVFRYALRTVTLLALGVLWLYTSLTTTIFWGIFIIWAVWQLDSRYVGAGALALLIAIPITLSLGEEEWGWLAEQLAVYVFFLLCITVGLQMIDMLVESRKSKVESADEVTRDEVENEYRVPSTEYRVAKNVLPATRTSVSETRYPVPSDRRRVPAEPRTRDRELGTDYGSPHILDLRPQRRTHLEYRERNKH